VLWGGRLWRHPDFLKLWGGQTISQFGYQLAALALPTLAILQFRATALQVGLLAALERIPFPILGLFTGVLVDRVSRRRLMIVADVARALILASIPAAAALHQLSLLQIYVAGLLLGIFTVLFDISYLAYLPSLVESRDLVEGNTKMQVTFSLASLAGPGLGGAIIQLVGYARAVGVSAVSYLASVANLFWIRREAAAAVTSSTHRLSVGGDIMEGLRLVFRHPVLRSLLLALSVEGAGFQLALPIVLIFFYRNLHLTPTESGIVLAAIGIGSIASLSVAATIVRRIGLGPAMAVGEVSFGLTFLAVPLALVVPAFPYLTALFFLSGFGATIFDVNQVPVRLSLTPARLQGRMNATFRTIFWGVWPVANVVGGLTASAIGAVATMIIGGSIVLVAGAIIFLSPLGRLRVHPSAVDAGRAAAENQAQ
jgi:MFS family permease